MAESSRLLLESSKLTNSLIEICQEFRWGVKDVPAGGSIDHQQVSDQLTELRGVLEELLNAAPTDDSQSLGLSAEALNGQLVRCRDELRKMEAPLKQGSGMKRIKGPTSSNSPTVLNDLAPITTDLRNSMAVLRPEAAVNSGSLVAHTAYMNSIIDSRYSTTQNIAGSLYIFSGTVSDNDDRQRIRDWLSAPDPSPNHHDAMKKRGVGTGLWLINGDLLQNWKFSDHSFAWFHGLPGCGKSVLCSTIIQDVITYCRDKPGYAVAYFYFDFTDTQKRQSSSLIRSFLIHLSFQLAECPEVLVKLRDRCQNGSQEASPADLMNTLKSVIGCFNRHVYLMIDALDECSDQTDLLTVLAEISGWKLDNLHVLATSRREPNIEKHLTPIVSSIISLDSDLVDADIRLYLSTTLVRDLRFRIWTAAERSEVETNLMQQARGMFRLVTCQLDELAKCSSLFRLRKTLRSLPRTLEDIYERILSQIDDSEDARGDAVKLLQWLAFSVRPLTLAEMAEVFAINRDEIIPRFDPDGRPRDSRGILGTCPSLITVSYSIPDKKDYSHPLFHVPASVRNTGTISLAHMSVKDYLISKRIKDSSVSFCHLDKKLADGVISRECLAYLMQFDTVNCLEILSEATRSFGRYAAEFWIVHARSDDGIIHDDIQPLLARLLSTESAHFQNWVALFDMDRYHDKQGVRGHPLYYASLLGLEKIAYQLASSSGPAIVNLVGGHYGSALASASAEGREEVAKILLANGADVNLEGGMYGSALGSASAEGCKETVQILLENGAKVDVVGGTFGSALATASAEGREEIVQILLDHGTDVDLVGRYYGTALASASAEGRKEIVQILLNSGADVNIVGNKYGTALASASTQGHTEIVRILLDNGAEVNLEGGEWGTALGSASARGCVDIVEILLEWGAEVNKVGKTYDSPLAHAAGIFVNFEIVKILLEHGAEMDLVGGEYGSALAAASTFGRPEIVQFLLENGAGVNIAGGYYGSALASASAEGYKEIVQMLLEHGADVDLIGGECGTALAFASFYRNEEIVQMLLEHGAKVNLVEGKYGSALAIASSNGCKEIVEILLKNGADVNQAAGGLWGSALASASAEGRKEIVEILLDKGADVNFKNENGDSALYYAAQRVHEAIVQLLLDHGADPDDMIIVVDSDDTPMDTVG